MKKIIFLIWMNSSFSVFSQPVEVNPAIFETAFSKIDSRPKLQKKGDFYFTWGYNRSWYNKSDIRFIGTNYDFILHDVVAKDRPSKLGWVYVDPTEFTIPQFNFRIGLFINDQYSISIGWDHMKYVVRVPQRVTISGVIGSSISDPGISTNISSKNYSGTYNHDAFEVTPDFLSFEHTDGLNFASINLERHDMLWQSKTCTQVGLALVTALGLGPVIPRSDVRLFGVGDNHYWNLSGWGVGASVGLSLNILSWLFIKSDLKGGYISLQKIPTTGRKGIDIAKQDIVFYENSWSLGFKF